MGCVEVPVFLLVLAAPPRWTGPAFRVKVVERKLKETSLTASRHKLPSVMPAFGGSAVPSESFCFIKCLPRVNNYYENNNMQC